MPNITTRADAVAIMADEIDKHISKAPFGSTEDYASGLFEGLSIGFQFDHTTFLAVQGSEDRLRYLARRSLIRQNLIPDPAAPPAGVA